jgi:hypothetical protein
VRVGGDELLRRGGADRARERLGQAGVGEARGRGEEGAGQAGEVGQGVGNVLDCRGPGSDVGAMEVDKRHGDYSKPRDDSFVSLSAPACCCGGGGVPAGVAGGRSCGGDSNLNWGNPLRRLVVAPPTVRWRRRLMTAQEERVG